FTSGVACPLELRSNARRSAGCACGEIPFTATLVSPFRLSAEVASCSLVAASSTLTLALPLPAPPGENSSAVTVSVVQVVTPVRGGGEIDPVVALPLGEKLTGACEISTLSSVGVVPGDERRACQRTPRTVSRKLSVSGLFATVTGKKSDQYSLPACEYGCRKLIHSSTVAPVEVRVIERKSRGDVDESPSGEVAQPFGMPDVGEPGSGYTAVAWSPPTRPLLSSPFDHTWSVD